MRRTTLNQMAIILTLLSGTGLTTGAGFAQDVLTVPPVTGNSIITLPPARVQDYWFTAEIDPDGSITLDGYAPDAVTKTRLGGLSNIDADSLEIGGGAPKQYDAAVAYGLKLLKHLQDGKFSLRANIITIKGTAKSQSDYDAALSATRTSIPDGTVLALAEIQPAASAEPAATPEIVTPAPAPSAETAVAPTTEAAPSAAPSVEAPATEPVPDQEPAAVAPSAPAAAEPPLPATVPVEPPAAAMPEPAETQAPAALMAQPEVQVAAPSDYAFAATRAANAPVSLSGNVPADAAKAYFGVVAGGVPTNDLTVVANPPADFTRDATAGLRALVLLSDGELTFADGIWSLQGKAASDDAVTGATSMIKALPDGTSWKLDISGPPAIETCRAGVRDFSASRQILFQSGSARLTDDSVAALAGLATILGKCPEAIVHVEGHTDSDGDDAANLALSVARAEAVIAVLTDKGIAAERLYAIGYGETLPVASNDTPAGKQANRRIVFDVLDK